MNDCVETIDMVDINDNGTIEIIVHSAYWHEYPFRWQYKIYCSLEQNENSILRLLFKEPCPTHKFSPRFLKYLENRRLLFNEASAKYLPIIQNIIDSDFSLHVKNDLIYKIDLELNRLYPYEQ